MKDKTIDQCLRFLDIIELNCTKFNEIAYIREVFLSQKSIHKQRGLLGSDYIKEGGIKYREKRRATEAIRKKTYIKQLKNKNEMS